MSLEEREVENLLPIALLEKVTDLRRFVAEARSHNLAEEEIWKYLDLKEGVSLKWIQKQDLPTRRFWQAAESSFERKLRGCSFCKKRKSHEKDDCGCCRVVGLGSKILTEAVNYLTLHDTRMNLRLLEMDTRWEKVGKVVFDFTVAPNGELVAA